MALATDVRLGQKRTEFAMPEKAEFRPGYIEKLFVKVYTSSIYWLVRVTAPFGER